MLTSSRTPSGPRRVTTSPSTAKSFAARCCGDWWPQEVSEKLQQFYDDLVNGQRPKVAIMAPPQHGKSTAATDFVTWVAGKDPNLKTIFASFSDQLGERTNKEVQRIMRTDAYIKDIRPHPLGIRFWDKAGTAVYKICQAMVDSSSKTGDA